MQNKEDVKQLLAAIELSKQCVPVARAFSVGALLFDAENRLVASGYSRETDEKSHAEEVALKKAARLGVRVVGGTLYSSLVPCGKRLSRSQSCADLIIRAGIKKVVFALQEPPVFVEASGEAKLREHGIEVVVMEELGSLVSRINEHVIGFPQMTKCQILSFGFWI